MRVVRGVSAMQALAGRLRRRYRSIGLVPTMGAFHDGHLSLIRASVSRYEATIVSVFVNPLQFGPREDFRRYPRTLARDLCLARLAGVDVVFAPGTTQLYPDGFQTRVEVVALTRRWEGRHRPGHFQGVATVVTKLFTIVQPTHTLFGQKDYQQALVVRQLIQDLNLPITLRILPTVREPDGLAMSSRNRYLSHSERQRATVLYHALCQARARIRAGMRRSRPLVAQMRRVILSQPHVHIDYVGVVDATTLEPCERLRGRVALLVAVRVGRVRLIDNLLVEVA